MVSNVSCANARLKRKLMLKEKKMKCEEKSHRVLLDEDHRRKKNCTPLSDITMMDFSIARLKQIRISKGIIIINRLNGKVMQ